MRREFLWALALALVLVSACSRAPSPADEVALKAPKPTVSAPPAEVPGVRVRLIEIVDDSIDDEAPWPAARLEFRNGLTRPISLTGAKRRSGDIVLGLEKPEVYRNGVWTSPFQEYAHVAYENPSAESIAPGGRNEISLLLPREMFTDTQDESPWRLCVFYDVDELHNSVCTEPFLARRGIAVAAREGIVPAPDAVVALLFVDKWTGLSSQYDARTSIDLTKGGADPAAEVTTYEHFKPVEAEASLRRAAVQSLLDALQAPPWSDDRFLTHLAEPEWLKAHAGAALTQLSAGRTDCPPAARELFRVRFQDAKFVREALAAKYASTHTDDYPDVGISVYRAASSAMFRSEQQDDWMVPWSSEAGENWNPAIGQALGALLPEASPNDKRLRGRSKEIVIAEAVRNAIHKEDWRSACP